MSDSNGIPVSKPLSARSRRIQGRAALWSITTRNGCKKCGRVSVLPGGKVGVRRTAAGVVGFAGLATCGTVWLCPVCNAKIMARRALEIGIALAWWQSQGDGFLIWGSLTSRHKRGDQLAEQLRVQADAWKYVVNSRDWRESSITRTVAHNCDDGCAVDCERQRDIVLWDGDGRAGYIRAAELTVGGNGWHPHFHPMIFWRGSREQAELEAATIVQLWVAGVQGADGSAQVQGSQQLEVLSVDESLVRLAEYVTKSVYDGLTSAEQAAKKSSRAELRAGRAKFAREQVWSQGKTGRGKKVGETVAHWGLLADVWQGDADAAALWWELEEATLGHRMIAWSRGLRDFAHVGAELTDEAISKEEAGDATDTVCMITAEGWRILRDLPSITAGVLDTLESGGWDALRAYLDLYGIEWEPVGADGSKDQSDDPEVTEADTARVRDTVNAARRVWNARTRPRRKKKPANA